MDVTDRELDLAPVYRALTNETRRRILELLKDPGRHFDRTKYDGYGLDLEDGVCVQDIQQATGASQSVTSTYLKELLDAGLLRSQRVGRWTYYRRDEHAIRAVVEQISRTL